MNAIADRDILHVEIPIRDHPEPTRGNVRTVLLCSKFHLEYWLDYMASWK